MELYDEFKRSQGLLDFTDLEFLALKLLDKDEILSDLKNRLSLTLVDEFQDTSPIQLSLFLKLAQVTGRSVWVGDEKQASRCASPTSSESMGGGRMTASRCGGLQRKALWGKRFQLLLKVSLCY
jgi:hypothetical protein